MNKQFFFTIINTSKFFRQHSQPWTFFAMSFVIFASFAESVGLMMFFPLIQNKNSSASPDNDFFARVFEFFAIFGLDNSFYSIIFIISLIFVIRGGLMLCAFYLLSRMRFAVSLSLKKMIIDGVSSIPISSFASRDSGYFSSLVGQHSSRAVAAFASLVEVYVRISQAVVFLAVAFYVSIEIGMLAFTSSLLAFVMFKKLNKSTQTNSIKLAENESILNSLAIPYTHAQKYLRATARLPVKRRELEIQSSNIAYGERKRAFLDGIMVALREPLAVLFLLVILIFEVKFLNQEISLVLVSLVLYYRVLMSGLLTQTYYQKLLGLIGSVEVIQEFLLTFKVSPGISKADRSETSKNYFDYKIIFDNVSFRYANSPTDAIKSVSLVIEPKSSLAIIGPSGSGKSTLIDLLTLTVKPTTGQILSHHPTSSQVLQADWCKRIGYVTQDSMLFDGTLVDNILLGTDASNIDWEWFEKVIEMSMLKELLSTIPNGKNAKIGEQGIKLSGGQRQRVFLARELFRKPDLLILDEATSALDSKTEYDVRQSLQAIKGKLTLVVVTHRLSIAKGFEKIVALKDGKIIEVGSYDKLSKIKKSELNQLVKYQEL